MNDLRSGRVNNIWLQKTSIVVGLLGAVTLEGLQTGVVHGIEHVVISDLVVSPVVLLCQITAVITLT